MLYCAISCRPFSCQLVRIVIQHGHELPVLRHSVDVFKQTINIFVQCRVCLLLRQARALRDPVRRFQKSDLLLQRCIVHLSRLRDPVADPVPRILPAKVFGHFAQLHDVVRMVQDIRHVVDVGFITAYCVIFYVIVARFRSF